MAVTIAFCFFLWSPLCYNFSEEKDNIAGYLRGVRNGVEKGSEYRMNVIMFLLGLVLLFALMIKTKYGPFVCMLVAGLFIGLTSGLGTKGTIDGLVNGFANTCKGIGLLVIFGTILGTYLEKSNACQRIANTMLRYTGNKNSPLALAFTGFIVAIPVFCDVALVLLSPIIKSMGHKSGKNPCALGTVTACSLLSTNAFVAPTPAPLAIVAILGLDVGISIAYGLVCAAVVTIASWAFTEFYLLRKPDSWYQALPETEQAVAEEENEQITEDTMPSFGASLVPILAPILLILAGSIGGQLLTKGTWMYTLLTFIGDKNIALALGIVASVVLLARYLPEKSRYTPMTSALKTSGTIVFITAAGGALSNIIKLTGVGNTFADALVASPIPIIFIPFLITGFSKFAQGSASVAGILAAGLTVPMCEAGLITPLEAFLSISAGSSLGSHVNNSFTWVFSEFIGYDIKTTLKSLCVCQNVVMSLSGMAAVLVISFFLH